MAWKVRSRYAKEIKDEKFTLRRHIRVFIQDINGLSPLEKYIVNFLRTGRDKKALKFAKKRLGSIKRAKKKVDFLNNLTRYT